MIKKIRDNGGTIREVIADLRVGDIIICKKTMYGKFHSHHDLTAIPHYLFIKDKEYKVCYTTEWDFVHISYVNDESGDGHFVTPDFFNIKEKISFVRKIKSKLNINLDFCYD